MGFMASVAYWAPLGWLVLGAIFWWRAQHLWVIAQRAEQWNIHAVKTYREAIALQEYGAEDEARALIEQLIKESDEHHEAP